MKREKRPGLKRLPGSPLYMQVKEDILSRIESSVWKENTKIPTEAELCREYQVSTVTMREALKQLVNEGKLVRIPGRGTFVTKPKMIARLNSLFSISRWAQAEGITVATRVIKVEIQRCNSYVSHHLGAKEGESVTKVERLRIGNKEPLMFEVVWIPSRLCPDLHLQDMTNTPLHDILRDTYGIPLTKAVESIEPVVPDDYIKHLMGLDGKTLLLKVEHSTFTTKDEVILFANSYYRGDRYKFIVELEK
ncbi:MAG: GntR family transcriptional regulator [Spirochaetia bacterium]|jgi:GntR family transcriptional regulator